MEKEEINDLLLQWYKENKRVLPFRDTTDAYRIWVSEIMLQQTRVEAMIKYYTRFMEALPTLLDLAQCEEDTLLKLWEGLGYYSRVRNLKKAAIICCEKYDGELPKSYDALLALPGIGPYTASAIAALAYKQRRAAIDGNVLRVMARLLEIKEEISTVGAYTQVARYFETHYVDNMGDLNQAFMDFANAICLPHGALRCNICPLQAHCLSYQRNSARELPFKKKKKNRKKERYTVVIYCCDQHVLLHKRSDKGLLAGMYEFILEEGLRTKKEFPKGLYIGMHTHLFSHIEWRLKGFVVYVDQKFEKEDCVWVRKKELQDTYSVPSAFAPFRNKILDLLK